MSQRPRQSLALFVSLLTLLAGPLAGQVPTTFNYQGRLLQNTDQQDAVIGSIDIVFSIWSGPAGDGSAVELWRESWTGVTLSNGIFSVLLGSNGSPLDPADFQGDSSLYLQFEIDGETLLPRQQLGSAPFAMVDEAANEYQDLGLDGDELSLSNSAATVDLSGYLDNTDEQELELAAHVLSLSNSAATVDLSSYLDNTDEQTLELGGNVLSISGSGSSVDLAALVDNTDEQDLSLLGTTLSLSNDPTSVDLSGLLDNTDEQDLSLAGATLRLSNDPTPVDLSGLLDNTDEQDLSLLGNTLSLSNDPTAVSLAGYLDNTDNQALSISSHTLRLSSDDGTDSVNLGVYLDNTDNQVLSINGTSLRLSSDDGTDTVSLAGFLDNTDSQNLDNVLARGNNANTRDITNLGTLIATTVDTQNLNCLGCVQTENIGRDEIGGDDISDNIYILHVDCNGECTDMNLDEACDVVENLRGLTFNVELIGVSCVHDIDSNSANQFVACSDGSQVHGDNECRAYNLRATSGIPCVDSGGTDAIITCLQTNDPR